MSKQSTPPKEQALSRRAFTVLTDELRAMLLFASTDDTRFVLNGVHFEIRRDAPALMIATDGRRLAVIESQSPAAGLADSAFVLTLSSGFLKPLCALAKSLKAAEIQFDYHPQQDRVIVDCIGKSCVLDCERGAVIEGAYPEWRKVVPRGKREPIPHLGLNAEYVSDFAKAAKLLRQDPPFISVNLINDSGALDIRINGCPHFYGVLMPAKAADFERWQPEFVAIAEACPSTAEKENSEGE